VVAVVEPDSEEQPAIERMKLLAKFVDFDVKLVACDYSQFLVEGYYFSEAELPTLRQEYVDERREMLESLAGPLRDGGLTVETEAIWSHPSYKAIVEVVEDYKADLVIHHVHRHSALSRFLLTNDDWQMARRCPAPLLMVKNKAWKRTPVILAAVDPMHARHKPGGLDHKILTEGRLLEKKLGGDLFVVHACGQFPLSGFYPADAKEQHQKALDVLADEFDIPAERRLLIDEAPECALQKFETVLKADLVIVGAVSRSIVTDVFVGSTTEKVLDFLDCDALLLRPD